MQSIAAHTPGFAPIEQMQSAGTDARGDLYSVGATMYQLLTGTVPPSAMARSLNLLGGQADPLPPIKNLAPNVPENVSNVIESALSVQAAGRPQSAREMRDRLFPPQSVRDIPAPQLIPPIPVPATHPAPSPQNVSEGVVPFDENRQNKTIPSDNSAVLFGIIGFGVLFFVIAGFGLLANFYNPQKVTQKGNQETQSAKNSPPPITGKIGDSLKLPSGIEVVYIPAGEFQMGSQAGEAGSTNDQSSHRVVITRPFWIGKYEGTQAQWESVMGGNPGNLKGADLPVEKVSWDDFQKFIKELNARGDGYAYRLPTEAEWEYACRAGTTEEYAGNLDAMGWYDRNSG